LTAVLGTEVFEAAGDEATAILISDLHVPADGGPVLASLRGALAAARALSAAVHVLGDLFDSYVTPAQLRTGVWREVAALFAAAAAAGTAIDLLHGNRDFLLGDEFRAASGARVVAGGLRLRLGGVDTLLLHGDELCQNDLPYQRARSMRRSRPAPAGSSSGTSIATPTASASAASTGCCRPSTRPASACSSGTVPSVRFASSATRATSSPWRRRRRVR
jgi:hypothetical protein